MKEQSEKNCVQCGGEVPASNGKRSRIYCSKKCSNKYYYHKYEQRPKTIVVTGTACCPNCGKKFEIINGSPRMYCSRKCVVEYKRRDDVKAIRKLAAERKNASTNESFMDFVISLYAEGYGRMAIVEALGVNDLKVKKWIDKYNNPDRTSYRQARKKPLQITLNAYEYEHAQTAEEWASALRDKMRGYLCDVPKITDDRPVYLMCGKIRIDKSAENLCNIVEVALNLNPLEEGIFAFCGKSGDIVRYIYGDGGGLRVSSRRKDSGTYSWPSPKLGAAICISAHDFELLLRSGNRYRNFALSWNDFNF